MKGFSMLLTVLVLVGCGSEPSPRDLQVKQISSAFTALISEISSYHQREGELPSGFSSDVFSPYSKLLEDYDVTYMIPSRASEGKFVFVILLPTHSLQADELLVYFPLEWEQTDEAWTGSELGWGGTYRKDRIHENWILYY